MIEHHWKDLTTAETKALWIAAEKKPSVFAAMLIAKFKEKNTPCESSDGSSQ